MSLRAWAGGAAAGPEAVADHGATPLAAAQAAAGAGAAAGAAPEATWPQEIGRAGRYLAQSLRLMVGLPDYGAYLRHMQATHPDQAPMSYEAFFRERQDARYGARGRLGRCC